MAVTHSSDISITVGLDENKVPEKLQWSAEDGGVNKAEAKAMLLSIWDSGQQETLKMVTDQVRSPTWARLLAEATAQVLAMAGAQTRPWLAERKGLYHLAGSGQASMFEWAQEILTADPRRQEQVVRQLLPARTDEFPTPAQRPLFSVLDCRKFTETFGISLPPWQAVLRLALDAG